MSDSLDKLKNIGAQKIYEDTHIPAEHVQAILYESFEGLSKIQFIGFISILEREYGEDLGDVRAAGIAYFNDKTLPNDAITDDAIFKASPNKKKTTVLYIIGAIILFIIAIFYTMQSANKTVESATKENKIVKKVKNTIVSESNITENNSSDIKPIVKVDTNESNLSKPEVKKESKGVSDSLKIIAKTKVWLGYIDVATNKKYQKTFEGEFDLDPTKEWLLLFGHGYVDIEINGIKEEFSKKSTLRLHYKDGKVEKISLDEFKRLNRGNKW
jgi:hypothetical protein